MDNSFDKLINRVLDGRYRIENVLGIGGMAYVLKATDLKEQNRTVAIKILNDEFNRDELAVKRFVNESKAVSMLSAQNIVKIYDIVITDSLKYIVMEYVNGITLKDYIDKVGALGWKEAVHYVRQILIGLSHAHEKGIIHRDVKPQNVMLLKDGRVKVTDFGIAKIAKSESITLPDNAIGTVNYVSPEQASGKAVDFKSDIYSVGVMFYEMVTGKLPFVADSPVAVAMKQVNEEPVSPRQVNAQIPVGLEQIILKAMSKNPDDRFSSANSMVKALEYFVKKPSVVFAQSASQTGTGKNRPVDAEKKGEEKKSKSMLPMILGVTVAFFTVVIASLVYLLFGKGIANTITPGEQDRTVVIESFVGETYNTEFVKKIESLGYTVLKSHNVRDGSKPENTIVRQDPEAGSTKLRPKDGSKIGITLYINYGRQEIAMPNCEATSINVAKREIENHFNMYLIDNYDADNIEIIEKYDEDTPKGYVIETQPKAGDKIVVKNDLKVIIYVSKGPEVVLVPMPEVVGETEAEAKRIIQESGLSLGEVFKQESREYPAGYVINASVEAGTEIEAQTTAIDLFVSRTPAVVEPPVTVPDTNPNLGGNDINNPDNTQDNQGEDDGQTTQEPSGLDSLLEMRGDDN